MKGIDMRLIGLVVGMILGNMVGSTGGALVGGVLGLIAGWVYGEWSRNKHPLEDRVVALEQSVRKLSEQVSALKSGRYSEKQFDSQIQFESSLSQTSSIDSTTSDSIYASSAFYDALPTSITPSDLPETLSASSTTLADIPRAKLRDQQISEPTYENILADNQWLSRLFKGNILAKIGVVILFFGIASGLKLAVDMGLFPISVRLMLGALAAIAMSIFGYHRAQQPEHRMFGQAMQGGGLGILYLLVYFMLARYQIIGETLAFVLFTMMGVACVLLAARQDSRSLAMLGISGAFLSPVMAVSSGGSQITLFSYFLLLNVFILSVNWFKGWRELNLSGFIFTLIIGMNWAFRSYMPSDFPVSETFLILFFLLYSATPVLFNLFNAPGRLSWGDGMLLYGTPFAAAALQNHLLQGQDMTLAWNACGVGIYYLLLWLAINRKPNEETVWLEKSLLGIAIGFFTLAIPLAFNYQLTSAFWTLEGFGVLYLGVQQNRFLARLSGSALQVLAGVYFFVHYNELQHILPVFNDWFVGSVIVVVAALASALLLQRTADKPSSTEQTVAFAASINTAHFALPFLYWSLLWWFGAGFAEIDRFATSDYKMVESLGLCITSFIGLDWLGKRRHWHALRQPSALLVLAILVAAYEGYIEYGHALHGLMAMLIPTAIIAHYWLLYRHDQDAVKAVSKLRHALAYWLLIAFAGSELAWASEQLTTDSELWSWLAWGLSGALGILGSLRSSPQQRWPFALHREFYLNTLQLPVVLLLLAWLLYGNLTHSGGGSGLPYLPVLNPFDLIQMLAMYTVWKWLRTTENSLMPVLYGIAFLWISAEAARLTHHWGGVPFERHFLLASSMLQASLSILWTAIAMGVMVYASRCKQRALWFYGFSLLAIVGIKLMMIDLSNKGTALWTASLIGIALLIIAASYFSPAPPKE